MKSNVLRGLTARLGKSAAKWAACLLATVCIGGAWANPVAQIGSIKYETLAAAIDDAQDGDTIELLDDIDFGTITNPSSGTGAVTIPSGKTVTLDLAGHKISVALNTNGDTYYNAHVLLVQGNLTVEDTSAEKTGEFINTYNNSYECTRAVRVMSGGTLTMNGGTVTATTGEAMRVDGTATLNSGVTVQAIKSANYGGWDNAVAGIELRGNATLTVNGAVVRSIGRAAIYSDNASNVITLNNGVFAGSAEHGAIYGSKAQESVFVKGGYYSSDPTDFINPQQYYAALVSEGDYAGYYFVGTIAPVLSTVTTKEELAAALATSTPQAPAYVTVSGDIIIDTSVELPFGATLTVPNGSALRVVDNGVLINKGEITSEGTISVTGTGFLSNPSSVNGVLSGFTLEADEVNRTIEWVVETPMDLQWISWICNQKDGNNYAYSTYTWDVKVANDITFPAGVEFEKIPQFTGVFDGQGHKINNLVLRSTSDSNAMFHILQDATVLNTEITATVETVSGYTGTLAYRTYGKVRIDGVTLNGTMTATGATYGIAPFVAMPNNAGTLAHLYIGNCINNMTVSAVNGWNTSPVCGTTANADWYGGKLGVYNFVNNGSAVCSESSSGYVVGYSMSPNLTIDVINYENNGSASTAYGQIAFDCTKPATFCNNSGVAWSNPVFDLTYASTDYTAYYHEDEDIYNIEPPPPPPVAAIANDETVLDMWNYWMMEGMVDAENNPCPHYVSITDDTMYRDTAVDEDNEEAWVSAKYLYDNYLADGKPDAGYAQYFVYAPGALMTKYESLAAALADVPANNAETVTILLIADNALAWNSSDSKASVVINKNNVVIDGQGLYKITTDGSSDWDKYKVGGASQRFGQYNLVTVTGTNVTLKDMTIDGGECRGVSCATTLGGRDVTYDGVTYVGRGSAHYYGYGNGTITFTDCTINTQGYAIHCSNENVVFELVVDSCTVNGWMSCGKATGLTIKDSHFGGADDTGKNGLLAKLRAYCNTTIENTTFSTDYLYVNDSVSTYCGIDCGIGSLHISLDGCSVVDAEGNPTGHDITEAIKTWNGDGENFANAVYEIDLQGDATTGYTGGKFVTDTGSVTCAEGYTAVKTGTIACYDVYEIVALKTVTFALGENAPDGATAPGALTYPSGNPEATALPLPTYTAENKTFAGWKVKDSNPEVVLSAIPAGADTDYELVATWTGAQKVTITESEETAEIAVTDAWIAQNVTPAGEQPTTAEIQEALNKEEENGLKAWENYVLGQNPTAKLTADAEQGAIEATLVTSSAQIPAVDTGFTVEYRLDKVTAAGVKEDEGVAQPTETIPLDLTEMEGNVAYYRTTAVITSTGNNAVQVEVPSENTIGVLKVENAPKTAIIAVPWESLDSNATGISVSDLVRTANLSEGDELHYYKDGKFKSWTLNDEGKWEASTNVSQSGTTAGDEADGFTIPRGSAVWLKRQNPTTPVYLVGEVTAEAASAGLEGAAELGVDGKQSWNMVASPSVKAVDLNEQFTEPSAKDRIIVPTDGAPKNYTFKNGKWGYNTTEDVYKGGVKVGVRPIRITTDAAIKAGTGFWYLNAGEAKDVEWAEPPASGGLTDDDGDGNYQQVVSDDDEESEDDGR